MSTLITLIAGVIVIGLLVVPLRFSLRSKIVLGLITVVCLSRSFIYLFVGGTRYDPDIPYNLSFVFDIARSTVLFLTFLIILRLVLNAGYKIVHRDPKVSLIPPQSPFYAQIMLVIAFVFAAYGTSSAYGKPEIAPYSITVDRLDPRLDGMKIVMMSDIHISSPTDVNVIYNMVKEVNALNPDLILMPGDLLDGPVEKRRPITDLLFQLKAKYGVFISAGNHEYYSGYLPWREYFEKGGLVSLDNKVLTLTDSNGKVLLNLGGITDLKAEDYGLPMPDIKGVTAALDNSAPSILLSHRPQHVKDFVEEANKEKKKIDLVLSGHTHGGLVVGLSSIVAKYNEGFVSGLYEVGPTKLIVCNGTMIWMGFPLRLGVPSQIDVITLHSKEKPSLHEAKLTRAYDLQQEAQIKAAEKKVKELAAKGTIVLGGNTKSSKPTETSGSEPKNPAQQALAVKDDGKATPNGEIQKSNVPGVNEDYAGLQIILPLVNTETGKVSNSITNLALLPSNLTEDQLERIHAIINEDPNKKPVKEEDQPVEVKPKLPEFKLVKDDPNYQKVVLEELRKTDPVKYQKLKQAELPKNAIAHPDEAPANSKDQGSNSKDVKGAAANASAGNAAAGNAAAPNDKIVLNAGTAQETMIDVNRNFQNRPTAVYRNNTDHVVEDAAAVPGSSVAAYEHGTLGKPDSILYLGNEPEDYEGNATTTLEVQAIYGISLGKLDKKLDDPSVKTNIN